jgi:undecaprenyl-diphosphatase
MVFFPSINLPIFHAINGLCGTSPFLDRLIAVLDFPGLKGLVLFGTFGALWFQPKKDQPRTRRILIVTLIGMALAIVAARIVALSLPFEVRPMYAPDIGYCEPLGSKQDYNFEAWSAFPSDQAAMMFALSTGFWFASRAAGIFVGVFSCIAFFARVFLGIHYPIDILVGALIGITAVILLNFQQIRDKLGFSVLIFEKRFPAFFYCFLFLVLSEVGTIFSVSRRLGAAVIHVLTGKYG